MSQRFLRMFRFPWRSQSQIAQDLDTELAFHFEMRVADLMREGVEEGEAYRRARAEFGDLEFTRSYCIGLDRRTESAVRWTDRLQEWRQDLTQAWRTVRRNPAFAAVSLLTLALAIGANTAIFSVIRAVLLRPLPYGEPERLVAVYESDPAAPEATNPLSALNLLDYRAAQQSFTGIAGWDARSVTWRPAAGDPELLDAVSVTGNTFDVLRVQPVLGRAFTEEDEVPGGGPKAILSYGLWQSAFGGDATVIGRTMTLNDLPYLVIGVMPRDFTVAGQEVMWTPLTFARERASPVVTRRQHYVRAIARLKPGVTLEAGGAELARISRRLEAEYPDANTGRIARLVPLHTASVGNLESALVLLQAASALVLLIACVNLANLTLSRGVGRRREMALRAALGAGRFRLLRQLLVESVLLAVLGGALGVGVAVGATQGLLALQPGAVPAQFTVQPDGMVLLFGFLLSIGTGVAFGLLPALDAARTDLRSSLQGGGRTASGGPQGERVRHVLVIAQVALAVVLLVGAGLLIRSFAELTRVQAGFDSDHVLTAEVRVSGERYDPPPAVNNFYDRLLEEVRAAPGVVAVGATMKLPAGGRLSSSLVVEGQATDPNRLPDIGFVLVRGDYFQALHIPLKAGRLFDGQDGLGAPGGILVNETAVRTFFPEGNPVGRRVRLGPDPNAAWSTVIGVVGDVREQGLELPPSPTVYASHVQNTWWRSLSLVVRTAGDPLSAEPVVRGALRAADPTLALRSVRTLDAVLGSSLAARRFALGLVSSFAAIALILAAVGIYGVLAFNVTSRTREFGVRLALGARRSSVLMLVLREGLGWSLLGLVAGLVGAFAGGRLLESRLYSVTPTDTVTLVAVVIGLTGVAALACLIPAARATRVDPIASLRAE